MDTAEHSDAEVAASDSGEFVVPPVDYSDDAVSIWNLKRENCDLRKQIADQSLMWQRLLETTPALVVVADAKYFRIVSKAWSRLLGWTIEELLSTPWSGFIHPDDRAAQEEKIMHDDGSLRMHFRNRYKIKMGGYRVLDWHVSTWGDNGMIYGIALDKGDAD